MKVLHIVSSISLRSGIVSFIMNYYRQFSNKDVIFDFLYYEERDQDYKDEIVRLGGSVCKVPSPMAIGHFRAYINEFCKQHESEYDVIHLHDPFLVLWYGALKKKLRARAFVTHAHNTRFSDRKSGELRNHLLSVPSFWMSDYFFACSKNAGNKIFGKKFDREGVVINNAIMLDRFRNSLEKREKIRQELGVSQKFVVGHIGNFIDQKNHSFLVDVFDQIQKKRPDACLLLVGDGKNRELIAQKCENLGISDKVHFLGTRSDVNEVVCAFDRFLFPSKYEGLGIVLIEAQAAGVPCIFSSAIPIEANIVTENNRKLDLMRPVSEWADSVLEESLSVTYVNAERVAEAGFDIATEAEKLKGLYQSMQTY